MILGAVYIAAYSDARLEIQAKIYADSFPEPLILKIAFDVKIRHVQLSLDQLVPNIAELRAAATKEKSQAVKR